MKKAKIVLSAVALFALVGGAFAYKAAKFSPVVRFTGTTDPLLNPNGACTARTTVFTSATGVKILASTTSLAANCPTTYTTAIE